ncbi:MAG: phenylalanine--tRNA ligase subunit alpha [Candidatus Aenigmarchaeota archaeon]|nr:phenylalanine--tRNA ligase subunit alpha [Candidatus Aenigmarchaeota archaeon]
MTDEKIIKKLHENEKRIIKVLEDKGTATVQELEVETGLVKDAIEKALLWAKVKGAVNIKEDISEFVELTKEGLEYLKDGLPERNLITLVSRGERSIENLRKKVKKFSIGLVWVKSNGWVDIKKGFLYITGKGKSVLTKKTPEEKVISALASGRKRSDEFDGNVLNKLQKRGLIKKRIESKKFISLTDLGKKISPKVKIKEEIGQLTPEMIISKEWRKKPMRPYDISIPSANVYPGKKHYMTQVIEYIRQIWLEMGFKEMTGPILEISFWNFDALYVPADHPARDLADTFYMKTPEKGKLPGDEIVKAVQATHEYGWTCNSTGWQYRWDTELSKECILRTHTTSLSARTLAKLREDLDKEALPAKYFSVGRCFRNETLDWQHLAEFYQTDGIVVGEEVTFRHLLGYLKTFFTKLGFPKARFRPSYFPYTEMSTEIEVFHPTHKKWVELGGAGMFRPEVVKPLLGKDIPVLAWGPGFERLVMINYGIEDIRMLYWNDLDHLRKAKIWLK